MNKISIINACNDLGVHVNGTNLGPEILTSAYTNHANIEKVYTLKKESFEKEFQKENKQKNLEGVNEFNTRLYNVVCEVLNSNSFPLTVGGDHSIAIATALASIKKYENMGIIWFDAHGDFNTFASTISGNIHGLPLASITHYEKELLTSFHNGNYYNFKNTVIVGGRDIDPLEKENLQNAGVTIFSTEDIFNLGTEIVCKKAFEIASSGTNGVHVSYDIDLIDPQIAPGVSIPAVNGINLEQAYEIADLIVSNKSVIRSADLVEFNPLLDIDGKTEKIGKTILDKWLNAF